MIIKTKPAALTDHVKYAIQKVTSNVQGVTKINAKMILSLNLKAKLFYYCIVFYSSRGIKPQRNHKSEIILK